jgi:hypothetical protein
MMEPPIAALLGTAVGAVAGLAGPLVGESLQAFRDRTKWRLDNQRDAYVNALQHLANLLNMQNDAQTTEFSAELSRTQASLGTVMIFCSESQRTKLAGALGSLSRVAQDRKGLPEIYDCIVSCARTDFRHR